MKYRALIVDDEPLARERIRTLLREEPDFQVAGECANGEEAVRALKREMADLVFLDIQMPGLDGFGVLREVGREKLPVVIFVTAHDRHALKAFEVHALDYLLKPFKQGRFKETVQRARETLAKRQTEDMSRRILDLLGQTKPEREHLARLAVRTGDRVVLVKTAHVEYIESAGNYVVLRSGKENHVLRETLSALEEQLDPKQFLRISRSALVNVDYIKELQPMFKGEHVVVMQDGKQLTMTRGIREVQEWLKF